MNERKINKQIRQNAAASIDRIRFISNRKKNYLLWISIFLTEPNSYGSNTPTHHYEYVIYLIIPIRSHFLCSTPHSVLLLLRSFLLRICHSFCLLYTSFVANACRNFGIKRWFDMMNGIKIERREGETEQNELSHLECLVNTCNKWTKTGNRCIWTLNASPIRSNEIINKQI